MSVILASSIRGRAHVEAFDQMVQERARELDLPALLIYLIDTVSAGALPYLAEQFNVSGFKGYAFARTEQERRDLIAVAIELNRLKGTPFAVRRAVLTLGYETVTLRENSALTCNGSWECDGVNTCGTTNWANLVIQVTKATPFEGFSNEELFNIRSVVAEYKNARTNISKISFQPYAQAHASVQFVTDTALESPGEVNFTVNDETGSYSDTAIGNTADLAATNMAELISDSGLNLTAFAIGNVVTVTHNLLGAIGNSATLRIFWSQGGINRNAFDSQTYPNGTTLQLSGGLLPLSGWTAFLQGTQWYLWPIGDSPMNLAAVTSILVNGTPVPKSEFIIVTVI